MLRRDEKDFSWSQLLLLVTQMQRNFLRCPSRGRKTAAKCLFAFEVAFCPHCENPIVLSRLSAQAAYALERVLDVVMNERTELRKICQSLVPCVGQVQVDWNRKAVEVVGAVRTHTFLVATGLVLSHQFRNCPAVYSVTKVGFVHLGCRLCPRLARGLTLGGANRTYLGFG